MSLSESGAVELKPLSDEATTTSESSSEDEKNKKKTEKEKERKTYQYSIIKEYDDYETAEQEILNLEIKGFKMSYKRFQSNSHEYYCSKTGCSVLMHLKLHTDSQKCSLYVNEIEHDHTNHIYNEEYNLPHKSKAKTL
jgi:hypothetical protein